MANDFWSEKLIDLEPDFGKKETKSDLARKILELISDSALDCEKREKLKANPDAALLVKAYQGGLL